MFKRSLIIAAMHVGFAGPALAGHCPVDVKKLEAAMPNLKVSVVIVIGTRSCLI